MKVKIEIELEVTTEWSEVEGCTEDNFKDHVEFVLRDMFQADFASDLDYVSLVTSIAFPDGE